MKIALISEWLDTWRGGAEASTHQFLYELVRRGVEVHVFTRSRPAAIPNMQVHTISGAAMTRTRRSMTFAHRVQRVLACEPFDVVHAISPFVRADVYQPRGGTVAETIERNLALVSSPVLRMIKQQANQLNIRQRYMLAMERKMLGPNGRPVVVAISKYVARQLQKHYGLDESRVRLIYNAVEVDQTPAAERVKNRAHVRREFGIADSDLLVLLVAHNFRLKGVHCWMKALSLLIRQRITGIRTIVVGKGVSPRWHRLARSLGVAGNLVFTGPSDRVTAFRHAADVVVHPTFYDPCSRVVLEGASAGLACVATRWDGAAEMIDDGRNGYVIDDPTEVAALADRVRRLMDAEHRAAIGAEAQKVANQVSMTRHVTEMLRVYEEIRNRCGVQSFERGFVQEFATRRSR